MNGITVVFKPSLFIMAHEAALYTLSTLCKLHYYSCTTLGLTPWQHNLSTYHLHVSCHVTLAPGMYTLRTFTMYITTVKLLIARLFFSLNHSRPF